MSLRGFLAEAISLPEENCLSLWVYFTGTEIASPKTARNNSDAFMRCSFRSGDRIGVFGCHCEASKPLNLTADENCSSLWLCFTGTEIASPTLGSAPEGVRRIAMTATLLLSKLPGLQIEIQQKSILSL